MHAFSEHIVKPQFSARRKSKLDIWQAALAKQHLDNERTSPGLMSPRRTASSSASGMEAALVLPYWDRLLTTRSAAQITPNR